MPVKPSVRAAALLSSLKAAPDSRPNLAAPPPTLAQETGWPRPSVQLRASVRAPPCCASAAPLILVGLQVRAGFVRLAPSPTCGARERRRSGRKNLPQRRAIESAQTCFASLRLLTIPGAIYCPFRYSHSVSASGNRHDRYVAPVIDDCHAARGLLTCDYSQSSRCQVHPTRHGNTESAAARICKLCGCINCSVTIYCNQLSNSRRSKKLLARLIF